MVGEIVAFVVLLASVAIFGVLAWRLTMHLVGLDPVEFGLLQTRLREWRTPEARLETSSAVPPAPPTGSAVADRVDRMLALLEDNPASGTPE